MPVTTPANIKLYSPLQQETQSRNVLIARGGSDGVSVHVLLVAHVEVRKEFQNGWIEGSPRRTPTDISRTARESNRQEKVANIKATVTRSQFEHIQDCSIAIIFGEGNNHLPAQTNSAGNQQLGKSHIVCHCSSGDKSNQCV